MVDEFDKFKVEIDYESQSFDDMDFNPYEIVIAASKYAREINDRARKYLGSNINVLPRNMAMKKLQQDNVQLVYNEEEKEEIEGPDDES